MLCLCCCLCCFCLLNVPVCLFLFICLIDDVWRCRTLFLFYKGVHATSVPLPAADNKSVDAIHERSAPSWRHLSKAANKKSVDARLVLSTEHCSGLIDRLFVVLSTDSLTDPNTASPFQVVLSTDFSISATVTQKSSTCNFCTIECRNSQRFT